MIQDRPFKKDTIGVSGCISLAALLSVNFLPARLAAETRITPSQTIVHMAELGLRSVSDPVALDDGGVLADSADGNSLIVFRLTASGALKTDWAEAGKLFLAPRAGGNWVRYRVIKTADGAVVILDSSLDQDECQIRSFDFEGLRQSDFKVKDRDIVLLHRYRDGRLLVRGDIHGVRRLQTTGALDDTFTAPSGAIYRAWPADNGGLFVFGADLFHGSETNAAIRIREDGTIDPTFPPLSVSGPVLNVEASGRIIFQSPAETINVYDPRRGTYKIVSDTWIQWGLGRIRPLKFFPFVLREWLLPVAGGCRQKMGSNERKKFVGLVPGGSRPAELHTRLNHIFTQLHI